MGQATAFWSLKPAVCLPNGPRGRWNRRQTAASFAERVPHVAFVFKVDMRQGLGDRSLRFTHDTPRDHDALLAGSGGFSATTSAVSPRVNSWPLDDTVTTKR